MDTDRLLMVSGAAYGPPLRADAGGPLPASPAFVCLYPPRRVGYPHVSGWVR